MHRVIRNVDAGEGTDARRLLAKVADGGPAAVARHEMPLELTGRLGVELGVDVAAEGEQAAPHRAISR
jgi:hypothetical protein